MSIKVNSRLYSGKDFYAASGSSRKDSERKSLDYRVAAFALLIIALVFFAAGNFLFGVGTLPSSLMTGMGYFYVIGGAFISVIALGIFTGALISGGISLGKHLCLNYKTSS